MVIGMFGQCVRETQTTFGNLRIGTNEIHHDVRVVPCIDVHHRHRILPLRIQGSNEVKTQDVCGAFPNGQHLDNVEMNTCASLSITGTLLFSMYPNAPRASMPSLAQCTAAFAVYSFKSGTIIRNSPSSSGVAVPA